MTDEKSGIRRQILRKRDSIDPEARKTKDLLIQKTLLSLPELSRASVVLLFASFRSEVSTFPLIEESLRLGKKVVLPVVDIEERELRLYEIKGLDELSPGHMGIPEPDVPEERERDINDITLVVMPGAAFDPCGNRLGYGAGYYDKLLSRLKRNIPLIALAYDEQIVASLPSKSHDVKIHMIVTDKRVIRCGTTARGVP